MIEQPAAGFYGIKFVHWFIGLLPAIIGAAISLRLSSEKASYFQRFLTFTAGVTVAHICGTAIVDYFHVAKDTMIDEAIVLVFGLFGMSTFTQVYNQIPAIVSAIRKKLTGY